MAKLAEDSVMRETTQFIEEEKANLAEELRSEAAHQGTLLTQLQDDLEIERAARRRYQQDVKTQQLELDSLQQKLKITRQLPEPGKATDIPLHSRSSNSYAAVLIEVNPGSLYFRTEFTNNLPTGGKGAARVLLDQIEGHLNDIKVNVLRSAIHIRAYSSAGDHLSPDAVNLGIEDIEKLKRFHDGFNQSNPMVEVLDLGRGGAYVNEKLLDNLKNYVDDRRCKHIVLGVPPESPCVDFLQHISVNSALRERITLLDGPTKRSTVNVPGIRKSLRLNTAFALGLAYKHAPTTKKRVPDFGISSSDRAVLQRHERLLRPSDGTALLQPSSSGRLPYNAPRLDISSWQEAARLTYGPPEQVRGHPTGLREHILLPERPKHQLYSVFSRPDQRLPTSDMSLPEYSRWESSTGTPRWYPERQDARQPTGKAPICNVRDCKKRNCPYYHNQPEIDFSMDVGRMPGQERALKRERNQYGEGDDLRSVRSRRT